MAILGILWYDPDIREPDREVCIGTPLPLPLALPTLEVSEALLPSCPAGAGKRYGAGLLEDEAEEDEAWCKWP